MYKVFLYFSILCSCASVVCYIVYLTIENHWVEVSFTQNYRYNSGLRKLSRVEPSYVNLSTYRQNVPEQPSTPQIYRVNWMLEAYFLSNNIQFL